METPVCAEQAAQGGREGEEQRKGRVQYDCLCTVHAAHGNCTCGELQTPSPHAGSVKIGCTMLVSSQLYTWLTLSILRTTLPSAWSTVRLGWRQESVSTHGRNAFVSEGGATTQQSRRNATQLTMSKTESRMEVSTPNASWVLRCRNKTTM